VTPDGRSRPTGAPVLVLRALGLGDALTGLPALRGLRRLHPGRPLLLAAPAAVGGWLAGMGVVDGVVPTDGLDAAPPGTHLGPHDAVDLHGRGPESHRLLLAGRPRSLLGFAVPGLCDGPQWRPDEHEVDRWCRLVRHAGGTCGPRDLRLTELLSVRTGPGRAPGAPVVLHPGAASGSRRWPAERWAELARRVRRRGGQVLVTGSPAERGLAEDVAGRAGLPPGSVVAGSTGLDALARLLHRCGAVVCGDTGVAHLATALRVPSVLLFGPVSPRLWGPVVDVDRHVVLWHGDGTGDPHGDDPDPALLRIEVDEVEDALLRLPAG
jgi:ADP-heptose:LPS heptosyltransferase